MTPVIERIINTVPAAKQDYDKIVAYHADGKARAEARWGAATAASMFAINDYRIREIEDYLTKAYSEREAA